MPQISEGGHMNFAPSDRRQIRLLEYMLSRSEHVSVERVCSGIGIPNIEAGNLALKVLATGGIYLAGGVAVHALRACRRWVL